MSWVLRRPGIRGPRYFTGAFFSDDPRSAVCFGQRNWAEAVLKTFGKCTPYRVVRRRIVKRHKCRDRCRCHAVKP